MLLILLKKADRVCIRSSCAREHTLIYSALVNKIFDKILLNDEKVDRLQQTVKKCMVDAEGFLNYWDLLEEDRFSLITGKFLDKIREVEQQGHTTKLWVQYMRMVGNR